MLRAAMLWAESRQSGIVTADNKAIDRDIIMAAQALSLGLSASEVIVVTSNSSHFSHLIQAEEWANIHL
jgi:hypothetical protein